jgi:hypothetical protein
MTDRAAQAFRRGLNQHGYAFQHRVIREAARLQDDGLSAWDLLGVEVPIVAGDRHSRIDFVLSMKREPDELWLLAAECKRVNPAFGQWCFARGSYHRPPWAARQIIPEVIRLDDPPAAGGFGGPTSDWIFDIGFALKTDGTGDSHPVSRDNDAVENACYQASQGLNGLVQGLVTDERLGRRLLSGIAAVTILPVVFTTASLVVSDVNLRESDLASGDAPEDLTVQQRDWLYYQYPQSPVVKHSIERGALKHDSFAAVLARDYLRTVAIVSPGGIRMFLQRVSLDKPAST